MFSLSEQAITCFKEMWTILAEITLNIIDRTHPFKVVAHSSNIVISAVLHPDYQPVFCSHVIFTQMQHAILAF